MAFVLMESCEGRASGLAPYAAPPAAWPTPAWAASLSGHGHPIFGRAVALAGAALVGMATIAALAGMLDRASLVRILPDALPLVVTLDRPLEMESASAGSAHQVNRATISVRPPSPIDASTPTPVSRSEWSVTRIPVVGSRKQNGQIGGVGRAGSGSAQGNGSGTGGTGAFDPYAGAAPQRRLPPLSKTADVLDQRIIDGAVASVKRRFPGARGRTSLRVRLSPTGIVLDVRFEKPISAPVAEALKRELLGKRLAVMDAGIGASATEELISDLVIG